MCVFKNTNPNPNPNTGDSRLTWPVACVITHFNIGLIQNLFLLLLFLEDDPTDEGLNSQSVSSTYPL